MHVQDEVALFRREEEVLATALRAREPATFKRRKRRVEGLQGGDVCRSGLVDWSGSDRLVE
jgi:hypothetical protein